MGDRNILFKEMKFRYRPTEEDFRLAREFSDRTSNDHIRGKRSESEVRGNIILGKLGEIAYKRYFEDEVSDVDWTGIPQGKEPDFVNLKFGTKIQIKTIDGTTKWCSFQNWNFDVLVLFRMMNGVLHYIDTYTCPVLKEKAKESNYGRYWYFYPEGDLVYDSGKYPPPPTGYNYYP
jgi:hypothetical protein